MSEESTTQTIRDKYSALASQVKGKIALFSFWRVVIFMGTLIAVYYLRNYAFLPVIVGLAGLAGFLYAVRRHAALKEERELADNVIVICDDELLRAEGKWRDMDSGVEFIDGTHPYTSDLNIFGSHSLFAYINRTRSAEAKRMLAEMLRTNLTDKETILKERRVISELAEDLEFVFLYLARAKFLEGQKQDFSGVRSWAKEEVSDRGKAFDFFTTRFLPFYSIAATVLYLATLISGNLYLILLLLPAGFILGSLKRHQSIFARFEKSFNEAGAYEKMLRMLESRAKESPVLAEWWQGSGIDESSSALKKLQAIAGAVDSRNNIFVSIVLNLLLLWDFQVERRLRRWKKQNAGHLADWLELSARVEAYLSFAVYHRNHPAFTEPEFMEDFDIEMEELRHVLLGQNAVPNSLSLDGRRRFAIITGANMAGKSTFLRTAGTALVLAMRGLRVPAKSLKFKPTQIYTSMLTMDSLGEGESYFFSELKRLKQITNELETGKPLFVILDEILKGTNSIDKAEGSRKFLDKLLSLPAKGLVATHDLSLCEVADEKGEEIINRSFEATFIQDRLHFDYKLREGVCQNMNAGFLLRKMGLTID